MRRRKKDDVRKNPARFLEAFLKLKPADENLQRKSTDEDLTEPARTKFLRRDAKRKQ